MPADSVECYSGHTYAQEPRALTWQGRHFVIDHVEASWRMPEGPAFSVQTETGERFTLHYDELDDHWRIEERRDEPRIILDSDDQNRGQGGP
jgi:hypothetical protein